MLSSQNPLIWPFDLDLHIDVQLDVEPKDVVFDLFSFQQIEECVSHLR